MGSIIVDRHGPVRVIRLNRPTEANCIDGEMAAELAEIAADCDVDRETRAVVLTGSGRFFCAGGDVKAMAALGTRTPIAMKRMADDLHRAISTFARMKAPLIVGVNGVAAGAGFSLALIGDIVFASSTATFTMAYTKIGLSPNGSSTYYLPRLIGLRRTQQLMLTNRMLSAKEAAELGVVTTVVDADLMMEAAMQAAQACAEGSPESHEAVKALLLSTFSNSLETQMEIEGRLIAACASTQNGREGIKSFLNRRPPRFK